MSTDCMTVSWWSEDINTSEGTKLYSLTSSNFFSQLINEPTHIQTKSSFCIDLTSTDQINLSVNSGLHASLHLNCHHPSPPLPPLPPPH